MTSSELLQRQAAITAEMAAITAELSDRLAAAAVAAAAPPEQNPAPVVTPKDDEPPSRCATQWHDSSRIFRSSLSCRDQARLCISVIDFGY